MNQDSGGVPGGVGGEGAGVARSRPDRDLRASCRAVTYAAGRIVLQEPVAG